MYGFILFFMDSQPSILVLILFHLQTTFRFVLGFPNSPVTRHENKLTKLMMKYYSKTCVRQPPLKLTLVVDVDRWLSYKGTCHVILLAKLHDMYLYKTDNFFHINHYLKSVSKVALLQRFYCSRKSWKSGQK